MSLKEKITNDMKDAMRSKDAERLGAIRMLLAAIKQKEVDDREELTDDDVIVIVDRLIKQRHDSIDAFEKAGRTESAEKEANEIKVLEIYLPERLSEEEITAAVAKLVADLGASSPADMGKVMGAAKKALGNSADMGMVSAAVKKALVS